jgi:TolA-binding protein
VVAIEAPSHRVPASAAYALAVSSYEAKDFEEAARRFASFRAAYPEASEAEDALFLQGSALAHAGKRGAAARVGERFLLRYPESFHARDAAVLVAREARDRGECGRARQVLERFRATPTPETVAALGACAAD